MKKFNAADFSSLLGDSQDDRLDTDDNSVQYLTFLISHEIYGVKVSCIKEIIEYGIITRVPLTPQYMRGVINLRGNVVPVIDMAIRLGKEKHVVGKKTCIVILAIMTKNESVDIGFVVDEVNNVMDVTDDMLMASPQFGSDIRVDFIDGMYQLNKNTSKNPNGESSKKPIEALGEQTKKNTRKKSNEEMVTFLNLDVVLSIDELTALAEGYIDSSIENTESNNE